MIASLWIAVAVLSVGLQALPFQTPPPFNLTDEQDNGYVVVIFKPTEGEELFVTRSDFALLISELIPYKESNESGPHFNFSECLRQRKETGVERCWATAPCENLKLFANEAEEETNEGEYLNEDCSFLVNWLHDSNSTDKRLDQDEKPSLLEVWSYGILSCGIISLSGISGLLFYPLMKRGYFRELMNVLMGLACGSLSATAIFQLIPETFELQDEDGSSLFKALICWCGIWIFYLVGIITSLASEQNKRGDNSWISMAHSHSHSVHTHDSNEIKQEPVTSNEEDEVKGFLDKKKTKTKDKIEENQNDSSRYATAAMVLIGDSLHNFVDGMSIGAGYSQSIMIGLSLCIGIACEEFPHELGDFAVLIKYGHPFKKALMLNYASASTIFLGLIVGIFVGQVEASIYIYAISAGLFLYISLGELIPELKEMVREVHVDGMKHAILAFILQNVGMLTGATILYLVTKYN